MPDRLYFRQLLSGRDFAIHDPMAAQMVNFVYLIGDRETGEAVVVDPAYAVGDLLDVLAADGMTLAGVLATHYHADHIGGDIMGHSIQGIRDLLATDSVPIHVQADEAEWVRRGTGVAASDLVGARQRGHRRGRRRPHRVAPHARPHTGQPVLPGRPDARVG